MKKQIPFLLIIFRLACALVIVFFALINPKHTNAILVSLISAGFLSDVLDGIVARRLDISTDKLRIWDSNVDLIFWIAVLASTFVLNWDFVAPLKLILLSILLLEVLAYAVSFIRFKKTVATHSYLAKAWCISLLVFVVELLLTGSAGISFWIFVVLGIVSRIEIIGILLLLKNWQVDVKSVFGLRRLERQ